MQKATRLATYDGHCLVVTWCMNTAALNWIWNPTCNQWSSHRDEVMCFDTDGWVIDMASDFYKPIPTIHNNYMQQKRKLNVHTAAAVFCSRRCTNSCLFRRNVGTGELAQMPELYFINSRNRIAALTDINREHRNALENIIMIKSKTIKTVQTTSKIQLYYIIHHYKINQKTFFKHY